MKLIDRAKTLRDKAFFATLICSGRRIGEVIRLKVSDINLEEGTVLWDIEKKRKEYKVRKYLPEIALELIKEYIETNKLNEDDPVFRSSYTDRPLTTQRWRQILHRICEIEGIQTEGNQRPRVHDLRHSCGVRIYDKTKDIRVVQNVLEHSDFNMAAHYARISTKDAEKQMREIFKDVV